MYKEDKELLLKDLCARQLYGVKAHYQYYDFVGSSERLIQEGDDTIKSIDISLGNPIYINGYHVEIENIKPYLRPMSSMTEEEKKEYESFFSIGEYSCVGSLYGTEYEYIADDYNDVSQSTFLIDWLIEHHFDYRGLIEKGLALEAPEGMYRTE